MSIPTLLLLTTLILFLTILTLLLLRLHTILNPNRPRPTRDPATPTHILIVLGSGGHTAEMLSMLRKASLPSTSSKTSFTPWPLKFTHRTYVISSGDNLSAERAKQFEEELAPKTGDAKSTTYSIHTLPRARQIHQPLYTAPWTCFICLLSCLRLLSSFPSPKDLPDIILVNGPATSTILIFASVLLRMIDCEGSQSRGKMRTVYVESWARVKRLSLSGRVLEKVVDRFLVQWESLASPGGNGKRGREFIGVLVE